MEFEKFAQKVEHQFSEMCKHDLFVVDIDKDELWNTYLSSFPAGTNPIYRKRTEHDCSCCRHFIKSLGNVVSIHNGTVKSIWDVDMYGTKYENVAIALSTMVHSKPIYSVFASREKKIGEKYNFGFFKDTNETIRFNHFEATVPENYVFNNGEAISAWTGKARSSYKVIKRSFEDITMDSIETVLELIQQNSLYRGHEFESKLKDFCLFKKDYEKLDDNLKTLFVWEHLGKFITTIGHIRNSSIGTLLVNLSEDMDLDLAVRKYEQIVAPANYKRPKAIYTKRMLEDAQKTVMELGVMDALPHRFATLDDITVNNILFCNRDSAKRIQGNIFDEMSNDIPQNPKKFSKVENIAADKFVKDILPTARELELFLENKHLGNMVSLIAPVNKDANKLFKWDNNFGWAYTGNITDSDIRENVKLAGGKVDGIMRFSIQWHDKDGSIGPGNDLDAHCRFNRSHIYFGNKINSATRGNLDVDIITPIRGRAAVENIVFPSRNKLATTKYVFSVHCFGFAGGREGFRAELEVDGKVYTFDYSESMRQGQTVEVAEVVYNGNDFTVTPLLPCGESSTDKWGVETNKFVPVSVVCYSPNYWDEQNGIGNRHYFFMLKGCVSDESPNGIFNEYLKGEFTKHRKVFEALGSKLHVAASEDQLSGVGFCDTKRAEVLVKVKGATERLLNIKF